MPNRTLAAEAVCQGVPLEEVAALLGPLASKHFGPNVKMEVLVEQGELLTLAVFNLAAASGPGVVAYARAVETFGPQFESGDELMVQVFFSPDQASEARTQDEAYLALTGISSVGCGFWPVARDAFEALLGIENRSRQLRQLVFSAAVDPDPRFVLRRTQNSGLILKERVEVRVGGEVEPQARGRRDLVAGAIVEVPRRSVDPVEVLAELQRPDLRALVLERVPEGQREFDWAVANVLKPHVLVAHVAGEEEGRWLP